MKTSVGSRVAARRRVDLPSRDPANDTDKTNQPQFFLLDVFRRGDGRKRGRGGKGDGGN